MKRAIKATHLCSCVFAPITGAWIETRLYCRAQRCNAFAPITGAWIETSRFASFVEVWCSHPSRVRGLKHTHQRSDIDLSFAPITGAWIETQSVVKIRLQSYSHPSRVRGLKLMGLRDDIQADFAPITGAWIETLFDLMVVYFVFRTHHGCVD